MLQNALFKAEAHYSELDPDKDNFYTIIESAKDLIKDNDWWVINEKKEAQKEWYHDDMYAQNISQWKEKNIFAKNHFFMHQDQK